MATEMSRITSKFQATIPRQARAAMRVRPGASVRWHVVRGRVFVDAQQAVKKPSAFLTNQVRIPFNAVQLVKELRNEIL